MNTQDKNNLDKNNRDMNNRDIMQFWYKIVLCPRLFTGLREP